MQNIETRHIAAELRMIGERKLTGYAAKFGELSLDLGGFRERINPGAFSRTLKEGDIRFFWNHNLDNLPLGRTKSQTLRLEEDEVGLHFEVDLPDTPDGRSLSVAVVRGDVDGMSFGFLTRKDNWTEKGMIRTLIDVDLVEISAVNYAAYGNSNFDLAMRSREQWLEAQPTTRRNLAELEIEIVRSRTT